MANSVKASAPGKLILFGEHIVVYGEPAIATAIDKRAFATATLLDEKKIVLRSNELQSEIESSLKGKTDNPIVRAVQLCVEKLGKDVGVQVEINSEIPVAVGLGSSASVVTAAIAAVLRLLSEGELSRETVAELAFEAEKIAHGNPSGIDTAITTYGGTIYFKKGNVEFIETAPVEIVVGNTNIPRNTKEIVAKVKSLIEDPRMAYNLFTISSIVNTAKKALSRGDLFELGTLMNKNQEYLRNLGVSSVELEQLIQIAINSGCTGAKLTGAGGGGCMIALAKDSKKIVSSLNNNGAEAFVAKINQEGVRIEE